MKKITALVALALLAVAGTGYAVTCAYDNVPGATLLVPYFRVSGTIDAAGMVNGPGTDTAIALVNVSSPGVIAHVTVYNKYSKGVFDFNIPMTGKDVVTISMRSIINGSLSPNTHSASKRSTSGIDPCGLNLSGAAGSTYSSGGVVYYLYTPNIGWNATQFVRFSHPEAGTTGVDWQRAIGDYAQLGDALSGFRASVIGSLDESQDIHSFTSKTTPGILDADNPACGYGTATLPVAGSAVTLTGYIGIDVVNYCTNWFPDQQAEYYTNDAIATKGWAPTYTPNVLIGDIFYLDNKSDGTGNISGDPAIALEFDSRLEWIGGVAAPVKTFYGKNVYSLASATESVSGGAANPLVNSNFWFGGDGREPLGDHYGYRFMANNSFGGQTWITIFRTGLYKSIATPSSTGVNNLCEWMIGTTALGRGPVGYGLFDSNLALTMTTYDNDENSYSTPQPVPCPPGPSGQDCQQQSVNIATPYALLESARYDMLSQKGTNNYPPGTTVNVTNPRGYADGWVDVLFRASALNWTDLSLRPIYFYNQAWVGVQHSAPGAILSVGHSAPLLNNDFLCYPAVDFTTGGGNFVGTVVGN